MVKKITISNELWKELRIKKFMAGKTYDKLLKELIGGKKWK